MAQQPKKKIRRPLAERAAAAEAEARRLKALTLAGDDDNVRRILSAAGSLSKVKQTGKKDVDAALAASYAALQKAMQLLGIG